MRDSRTRLTRFGVCFGYYLASLSLIVLAGVLEAEPNVRVSTTSLGPGLGDNSRLRWDHNGRFAVFHSIVQDLIPGQGTANLNNIFLFDRLAGTLKLVSHIPGAPATGGNGGAEPSIVAQISDDGNWVAYTSTSTDLVAGQVDTNAARDVFLWNRVADTTQLVSRVVSTSATAADAASATNLAATSISRDGRFVVFFSGATNLVSGQSANAFVQAFLFDRDAGNTVLVSHAAGNPVQSANELAESVAREGRRILSADGRWVVFQTVANDLISGLSDLSGTADIFLWDRLAPEPSSLRLLSHAAGLPLTAGNGPSSQGVLSADGSAAAFASSATNLEGVTSDTNSGLDVYHYDRPNDLLTLLSHSASSATQTSNGSAFKPAISAAGDVVAFESFGTNLVAGQVDTNAASDIFLWQGNITLVSHLPLSSTETGSARSVDPILAEDGSSVAFPSNATNLVTGLSDTNNLADVFLFRRQGAGIVAVSHTPAESATGNSIAVLSHVALGGSLVSFTSSASNLVAGDTNNGGSDVFVHGSLLMADSFESGDFSAWSLHVP